MAYATSLEVTMGNLLAMLLPGLTSRFRVIAFWLWFPVLIGSVYLRWWLGSMHAEAIARSVFGHLEAGDVGLVWGVTIIATVIVVKILLFISICRLRH
jgi:hypothetical protein